MEVVNDLSHDGRIIFTVEGDVAGSLIDWMTLQLNLEFQSGSIGTGLT